MYFVVVSCPLRVNITNYVASLYVIVVILLRLRLDAGCLHTRTPLVSTLGLTIAFTQDTDTDLAARLF